jgi:colanic acid/amylovoran biosynthesis protein
MLIEQAARCRIVVTGAYHAAVFALAQGVPVVCLANSPYYSAKFQGLQDQFGPAVEIIQLTEPDFTHTLAAAMERSWTSATTVRSSLLQSAARQVERSREAYRLVKDLIGSRTQEMSLLLPDGNRPGVS